MPPRELSVEVNGVEYRRSIDPRMLLSDFLRAELGLTGTHVGCEQGVCGSCTVQVDGVPVRSCLTLAVQTDERSVRTVEALAPGPEELHPLQEAFRQCHGLQCGFCTPGFLMSLEPVLDQVPDLDDRQLRELISGNICRCTGYQGIVDAVRMAADNMRPPG